MTASITGAPHNEGKGGGTTESTVAPTTMVTTEEEVDYYDDYEYEDTLDEGITMCMTTVLVASSPKYGGSKVSTHNNSCIWGRGYYIGRTKFKFFTCTCSMYRVPPINFIR